MSSTTIHTPADWRVQSVQPAKDDSAYSADHVIDAYLSGVTDVQNRNLHDFLDQFKFNLKIATALSETLVKYILKNGYAVNSARIKVDGMHQFTCIFLIPEEDYCKASFLEVYEYAVIKKKEINQTLEFNYSTIFAPVTAHFNLSTLIADGYILTYEGLQSD